MKKDSTCQTIQKKFCIITLTLDKEELKKKISRYRKTLHDDKNL